ncbi:hypothetical protein BCR43DRAFT_502032 [Syncephalastrum racemosum]|uniref:Uncharacterized protein n=1 Tax=Syncephalastrum racemosum TaxID=13706 RepID=A0A1X2HLF5_SYNRA|nr:hypothetical protein BCR43DRAFT_502032 [Syncephalastrum racemosum]
MASIIYFSYARIWTLWLFILEQRQFARWMRVAPAKVIVPNARAMTITISEVCGRGWDQIMRKFPAVVCIQGLLRHELLTKDAISTSRFIPMLESENNGKSDHCIAPPQVKHGLSPEACVPIMSEVKLEEAPSLSMCRSFHPRQESVEISIQRRRDRNGVYNSSAVVRFVARDGRQNCIAPGEQLREQGDRGLEHAAI